MTKTFTRDGFEYTVTPCTAVALFDIHEDGTYDPINRQDALNVVSHINGEEFEYIVFGYDMPETEQDFDDMAENTSAWECDHAVLGTVWTDPNTNRKIVQEGLDRRAEARAEATQEEQEAIFLEELNKITAANYHTAELIRDAQERVREKRKAELKAKHQMEAEATRRDTFMQRLFVTVAIIAAVILLWNYGAVALWLALTIGIVGLIYIIAISVGYWRKPRRKADNHA